MNVNFLIIAWRGFNGNEGQPTEKGLYEDGESAVEWLKINGVMEKNIIIYGRSLGTGIATEISQNKNFVIFQWLYQFPRFSINELSITPFNCTFTI